MSNNNNRECLFAVIGDLVNVVCESDRQRLNQRINSQMTLSNLMVSFHNQMMQKLCKKAAKKRIWSKPRNTTWWSETVMKTFEDCDWVQNFRVDKSTFF